MRIIIIFKQLMKLFLVALLYTCIAGFAYGQSVDVTPNGASISFSGEIGPEALRKFNVALSLSPGAKKVTLSSPGGLVVPALEIASLVNTLGISTEIPLGATCESACSIIFFAGASRLAKGQLGVHQISGSGSGAISGVQYVLSNMLDAFEDFGVDRRASRLMLTTPPERMYFFSATELTEFKINRTSAEPTITENNRALRNEIEFSAFPALAYLGRNSHISFPDFSGRDKNARLYRTRIRVGLRAGPNFAGHYSLTEIGCGTSCRFAFITDAKTGLVFSFPYGGEEQYEMQLLYNLESRLLKVTWMKDEDNCIQKDLEFSGREFVFLGESTFPRVNYCN